MTKPIYFEKHRLEYILTILTDVQFYSQFQLLDVLEIHPEFYIQFIQSSLQLAVTYNFTESGTGNFELKMVLDYFIWLFKLRMLNVFNFC